MKKDKIGIKITKAISDAKDFTSHVKDDELRKIAFERVLDRLLENTLWFGMADEDVTIVSSKKPRVAASNVSNKKSEGPRGWLQELIKDNFFAKPKSVKDILTELQTRSHHLKSTDLTLSLQHFCHERKLRRLPKQKGKLLQWVRW